jgi:flagellar hook protein FlgE
MPFRIALSGLNAASADLRVIGHNVANASTTGFKKSRAEFADIFPANSLGTSSNTIGSGVKVGSVSQQFTQGNIDFTDNNLDLAISGQGFFRLNDNGTVVYSRGGAFGVDRDGYVVNSSAQRLTAYEADLAGNITGAVSDLRIDTSDIPPNATTAIDVVANLDANSVAFPGFPGAPVFDHTDPTTYNRSTSLTVFDSLGNPLVANLYFRKTSAPNVWETHLWLINNAGADVEVLPAGGGAGQPAVMTFDTSGRLVGVVPSAGGALSVDYQGANPATGGANLVLDVGYAGTTQFGSDFGVSALSQDGFTSGRLSGIDISDTGVVQARYTNGQTRTLAQISLANFSNPQGLQQLGDTIWAESFSSGAALVGIAGSANLGLIQSGALEGSNVDLTEQLVKMITAQRNFQANAQVITTADTVTQTIINIR